MKIREVTPYDRKSVYKKKIAPIIAELKKVCTEEHIPMFVVAAYANDPQKTTYAKEIVHAGTGEVLKDDRIADIILKLNGFKMNHPKKIQMMISELEEYMASISSQGTQDSPETTDSLIEDLDRITGSEKPQVFSMPKNASHRNKENADETDK